VKQGPKNRPKPNSGNRCRIWDKERLVNSWASRRRPHIDFDLYVKSNVLLIKRAGYGSFFVRYGSFLATKIRNNEENSEQPFVCPEFESRPALLIGWGTRIRTSVNGARTRRPAARRSPKPMAHVSLWPNLCQYRENLHRRERRERGEGKKRKKCREPAFCKKAPRSWR
jgi:hypothetical protein